MKAADLSLSSVHKGGIGKIDPNRGIGLRFPRFIRERDDKGPEDATSAYQLVEFYQSQECLQNNGSGNKDAEEDFDFI